MFNFGAKAIKFDCVGLQCVVIPLGDTKYQPLYHNGYVSIPTTHELYEKDYSDFEVLAHGGITYSEAGAEDTWVLGFDTMHIYDTEETQSLEYVIEETKKLAERLAKGEYNVTKN